MSTEPTIVSTEEKIAAAEALIARKIELHPRDLVVTNSFQAEDMVVLHIARQLVPEVPVVFLDTGYHFAEIYEYRDRITRDWNLKLINLLPEITVAEQESQFGILNQVDPGRCCGIRKVEPLFQALEGYALWFTGLRR
jgi:phosphoadenosine phosphosulfate reductase